MVIDRLVFQNKVFRKLSIFVSINLWKINQKLKQLFLGDQLKFLLKYSPHYLNIDFMTCVSIKQEIHITE